MSLESSAVSMDAGSPAPQVGSVPQGDSVMAGSCWQAVGCPFRSEVKPQQSRVEHLAQIEQERRIEVAQAKAVLRARKYIDAAHLGRGPNFALYDVEDDAWGIIAEEPDPIVLAMQCQEALDHLQSADEESECTGMGGAPHASAIRASSELVLSLGGVLAALQEEDPRDADDIMSDLRAQLAGDGATVDGARRALWSAVARYRRAKAARRRAEASDRHAPGALRQSEGG